MFFAEHNVALTVVDHLIPLLKEIVPDSEIIKNVDLGRKKCTSIIKNVVAKEEKDNLVNKLKVNPFSVMIDESTDIGLNKHMCILARFYDEEKGRVMVKLLDLLPIGADCTADALNKTFKELILSLGIPFNNIIGMCSDGANVMVGKCNSFAPRLINDVVVVKCICLSAAIIASKACLALPRAPEVILRQIGSYVSGSSKRCAQLEAVQEMLGGRKKTILRMCATRWLSHHRCVESVLENWEVLLEFFKQAAAQDKLKSTEISSFELNNECNRAYLLFLKYVLNYFNTLNAPFQSKVPLIHVLQRESEKLFLSLGQNFIKSRNLILLVLLDLYQ
ncbi:PREDICTED: uncharacterized protein LOC108975974, partial [Bactrocera latifrons]|uniref:uncharacterized protein LOC108975974 n=1 Tax=Bactrocera latifrons TaxID=174628 RepID=UPI0008DE7DF5